MSSIKLDTLLGSSWEIGKGWPPSRTVEEQTEQQCNKRKDRHARFLLCVRMHSRPDLIRDRARLEKAT